MGLGMVLVRAKREDRRQVPPWLRQVALGRWPWQVALGKPLSPVPQRAWCRIGTVLSPPRPAPSLWRGWRSLPAPGTVVHPYVPCTGAGGLCCLSGSLPHCARLGAQPLGTGGAESGSDPLHRGAHSLGSSGEGPRGALGLKGFSGVSGGPRGRNAQAAGSPGLPLRCWEAASLPGIGLGWGQGGMWGSR